MFDLCRAAAVCRAAGATMGEQVKGAIPGTREYEATHGMTGAHRTVEQAKGYIPGRLERFGRSSSSSGVVSIVTAFTHLLATGNASLLTGTAPLVVLAGLPHAGRVQ